MIHGQGGFLGADLSTFGSTRSAKEIRDVITDPKNREGAHGKTAVAVTRDGHRVTGLVRNEDNFSLQVLTARGEFYSLERSALESLEYQDHSPMPSDYGERLSPGELDDLVSYLMIIGRSAEPVRPVAREEE